MKKLIAFFLNICFLTPLWAQQTKILTAEKHNEYGLVYTLPITALRIDITAVKETKVAGPFSNYSKIFTSNEKAITENSVNWYIESVDIIPYGIPNPDERYLMQLKAGATTFISVSDDGMLLSINKETEIPETDKIISKEVIGTPVSGKEYLEYVNEDFLAAISPYKKAQLLAEELMEIRESKISLTRGTAESMPTDGRQLELMLESLKHQEETLTNAFIGSSWKEKMVMTYTYVPANDGREVLCKLNPTSGLNDAANKGGDPVYISVTTVDSPELPVDSKGEEKKIPKDAVIYCIPGTATVTVSFRGSNLYQEDFELSQFGMKFGLSPSIFSDKKEPSYAVFDPATGALKELGTVK